MRIGAAVTVVAVLSALAATAGAQPVVSNEPPVVANQPPVVENRRPQRYVLASGTIVDGTPLGEDAEFYTVQTAAGPVRIRKGDVVRIEFLGAAGAAVAPAQAPAPAPRRRHSTAGGILLGAGLYTFGTTYLVTMLIGAFATIVEPDALWLLCPVVGPMVFYSVADLPKNLLGLMLVDSVLQGIGLGAAIAGGVLLGSDDEDEARGPGLRVADRAWIAPAVATGGGGLVLSIAR